MCTSAVDSADPDSTTVTELSWFVGMCAVLDRFLFVFGGRASLSHSQSDTVSLSLSLYPSITLQQSRPSQSFFFSLSFSFSRCSSRDCFSLSGACYGAFPLFRIAGREPEGVGWLAATTTTAHTNGTKKKRKPIGRKRRQHAICVKRRIFGGDPAGYHMKYKSTVPYVFVFVCWDFHSNFQFGRIILPRWPLARTHTNFGRFVRPSSVLHRE